MYRERVEPAESVEGEGLDEGDVIAVEDELLEELQSGEGVAADHREVILRQR